MFNKALHPFHVMASASEINSVIADSVEALLGLRPDCVSKPASLELTISEKMSGTSVLVQVPVKLCNNGTYFARINGVLETYGSLQAIGEAAARTFRRDYTINAMSL